MGAGGGVGGGAVGFGGCVGAGTGVAVGARFAEGASVGGTSVGGAPGEAVLARATGDGVPCKLIVVLLPCRFKKNTATATTITSTPSPKAIHGHRLEGSPGPSGGIAGRTVGGTVLTVVAS